MSRIKSKLEELRIERQDDDEQRSRAWILIAAAVVVLLAAAGWWIGRPKTAEVRTAVAREVRLGEEQTVLNASGYVTARRQATVSSKVTGKVTEVLIEEGMIVEEGQILARLDDANVAAAFRLSQAQLESAKKDVEETRVRLAQAKVDLDRTENLVKDAIASQAELDRDRAEVDSLAARLESQRSAVQVAERSLALSRQTLEDMVIRSPFTGVVVAKNAQPGEMISPAAAGGGFTRTGIGTIVDMSSLEIEVDVNEAYINRVQPGQQVTATLDAYTDWEIPSSVIAIIPTADRQKATVQVRIGFDELDSRILPDMGVKVAFQGGAGSGSGVSSSRVAVALPKDAVREESGRDVVLVVLDGKIERRAVNLDQTNGEEVIVLSGVAAGERVVLEGPADLTEGDSVKEMI